MPFKQKIWGRLHVVMCAFAALLAGEALAQSTPPGTSSAPVTDGSTQASPIATKPVTPVDDMSAEASPITGPAHRLHIAVRSDIAVQIVDGVDSAHIRNGDLVPAVLASPLKTVGGPSLAAGTHVAVTVVSVAAAGKLESTAEMTLQTVRVGKVDVLTNILEFHGKLGHRDLPDSAPDKGTEAAIAAGTVLHFQVQPQR